MKKILITLAVLAALIGGSWLWVHHAYAADKTPEPTKEQLVQQLTTLDKDYQLKQAQIQVMQYQCRDILTEYKAAKAKLDALAKAEKPAKGEEKTEKKGVGK